MGAAPRPAAAWTSPAVAWPAGAVVRSACVAVSGTPALPAFALWVQSYRVATAASTAELVAYLARQYRAAHTVSGTTSLRARCQGCRAWVTDRAVLEVVALRIAGYCPPCAARHVAACLRRWDRLPSEEEFFCLGCHAIVLTAALAHADHDGRRRWRCRACRARQVATAAAHRRAAACG